MSKKDSEGKNLHKAFNWEHTISDEEKALLTGPRKIHREFYRSIKIFIECMKGFIAFRHIKNCVTVFGSARFKEDHPYYQLAQSVGKELVNQNFTVMTGGGPGIMEAANRGAKEANGLSIGCNIHIPEEQSTNPYLDKWITFKYFFVRKVMLTINSRGFIIMPGGFGTLDEFFEMATLIQTKKIADFPLVLMGTEYWQPLVQFFYDTLAKAGTIDEEDANRILLTDSPEEAIHFIRKHQRK